MTPLPIPPGDHDWRPVGPGPEAWWCRSCGTLVLPGAEVLIPGVEGESPRPSMVGVECPPSEAVSMAAVREVMES